MQRILKQYPEENPIIEANNLLATKPIKNITKEDILDIENRYNISLSNEYRLNLEEFYATYLNHCLKDRHLSEEELEDLKHLKNIFCLNDHTITTLHNLLGESIYKESFQIAVADGRLTKLEKEFLEKLESNLKISKELADKISYETRTGFVQNYFNEIVENQRLAPLEEEELYKISSSLNVTIQQNEATKQSLQKLKHYWALENLELPEIKTDIPMQKAEQCYFEALNINWYELRSRVNYNSHTASFRTAKDFYLQSGPYKPKHNSSGEVTLIDNGALYLTNKRILFMGNKKNSIIRLDKILNLTPYIDAIGIGKETGKSPILEIPEKADICCLILERLIREQ